jgi:hypothetical protein
MANRCTYPTSFQQLGQFLRMNSLVMADGLDPDQLSASEIRRWVPQLVAVFVKHMGADVVDSGNLRSEFRGA